MQPFRYFQIVKLVDCLSSWYYCFVQCCHGKHTFASSRTLLKDHVLYTYVETTRYGTVCYLLLTSSWALGTNFKCSNGEILTMSLNIVNFYVSDVDVTRNCLHVKWFKIYTSVSLRLNIQNINCLAFTLKINYRHIHAVELTDRACENGSQNMSHFNSFGGRGNIQNWL